MLVLVSAFFVIIEKLAPFGLHLNVVPWKLTSSEVKMTCFIDVFLDEYYNEANGHKQSERFAPPPPKKSSPTVKLKRVLPNNFNNEIVSSEDSSGELLVATVLR